MVGEFVSDLDEIGDMPRLHVSDDYAAHALVGDPYVSPYVGDGPVNEWG